MAHKISQDLFISIIPGSELSSEIRQVMEYCKENNCLAQLEFNGQTNWISQYSNLPTLTHAWYDIRTTKSDILAQIRDKKIDSIL
jgi:hypothetical protein